MLTGAKQTRVGTAIERVGKKALHDKIFIKVFRANSLRGDSSHYFDTFEIPIQRWTTVLDALLYAKIYQDSSIGIRYSCRMASCGSCAMKINGIPRLACYTRVSELTGSSSDTITCEPLSHFPHIRDLVTDFSQFFNHHKDMQPYIHNENADIKKERKKIRSEETIRIQTDTRRC